MDEVVDEHHELVSEIPDLEKLSAQARLERAKERRLSQLLRWEKRAVTEDYFPPPSKRQKAKNIRFQPNITLIEAAARNDAEEVIKLIQNGFSCDLQNEDGLSALHQAVIEDCEDVVYALVEKGASLDIKDADLWTPLHAAVACGNYDLVVFLVEKGASVVEINADGNMPIDLCEENEDVEKFLDETLSKEYTEEELENLRNAVADEMLNDLRDSVIYGRDLNIADDKGATAVHIAAANGYLDVLEYLIEHEVPIDMKDNDGWQPIHAAACWGQDKVIDLLFQHGADLDAKTNIGESPFDLSEDDDLVVMMQELKQNGRKTKELKRSQSNSSRTLCVRRSSIVDKHRMSINDAKSEGMILQSSPDYKDVYLHPDVDPMAPTAPTAYSPKVEPKEVELPQGRESGGETLKKDEETKVRPEANAVTSEVKAAAPEPKVAAPEPKVAASEPKVAAPEPKVVVPEPKVAAPEPEVVAPKPVVPASQPKVASPEAPKVAEKPAASTNKVPNEVEDEKILADYQTASVTVNSKEMKSEFKKQPANEIAPRKDDNISDLPGITGTTENKKSAPIAKKESDAPRQGVHSPSDVAIIVDDSTTNSAKGRNAVSNKYSVNDSKTNELPEKKCCVIL